MNTEIIETADGSFTLKNDIFGETYHSINGAISESKHIFINLGLKNFQNSEISILEVGYGTGLNAIMTFIENQQLGNKISYHSLELYPISSKSFLKYANASAEIMQNTSPQHLEKFCEYWNQDVQIDKNFSLYKQQVDFCEFVPSTTYDLVYFDAFSPETQPEMWSRGNLQKIVSSLKPNGYFVTYCCKGIVKQSLRDLGMVVKRFPGPKGKRHVIQASKPETSNGNTIQP
ncbi:MAG: tRNA (5-methylaminomethyl-2-thiouridine)(34)-methyltransferase MnmD [Bacteroidales bacterium]|nr:tRNA (5-methylaminomethyl-2-thiouridine)(34)-methyltransferase MnmD [Bacteroidales bacterium]